MEVRSKKSHIPLSLSTLCVLGTLALLAYAFLPAMQNLGKEWMREEYSHGALIPFLSLLMAWHRLAGARVEARGSWWGLAWLAGGLMLLVLGQLAAFKQVSYLAVVVAMVGAVWFALGKAVVVRIAPAFVFLLFAIPLPTMLYSSLSLNLKLISSSVGVAVLQLLDFSVYQDGNIIDLGTYKLQVVDACSGLRYLFPALSFAFLIAYLMQDRWWKKVVLFLSAIPITILMNAFRIAVVGITVNIWGTQAAEGFTHFFEGVVVFLFCVLLLMGEMALLLRVKPTGQFCWSFFSRPEGRVNIAPVLSAPLVSAAFALSLLFALMTGSGILEPRMQHIPPSPQLREFPLTIDFWHGHQADIDKWVLRELSLDDYWIADYLRPEDETPVNLYVAYYANQQFEVALHSPSTCLPGSGWKIDRTERLTWTPPQSQYSPLHLVKLLAVSGENKVVLYYWFSERGRNITNQFEAKWFLLVDSLLMGRSDGALVRVMTGLSKNETEAQAESRLRAFLASFYEPLATRLPQ